MFSTFELRQTWLLCPRATFTICIYLLESTLPVMPSTAVHHAAIYPPAVSVLCALLYPTEPVGEDNHSPECMHTRTLQEQLMNTAASLTASLFGSDVTYLMVTSCRSPGVRIVSCILRHVQLSFSFQSFSLLLHPHPRPYFKNSIPRPIHYNTTALSPYCM